MASRAAVTGKGGLRPPRDPGLRRAAVAEQARVLVARLRVAGRGVHAARVAARLRDGSRGRVEPRELPAQGTRSRGGGGHGQDEAGSRQAGASVQVQAAGLRALRDARRVYRGIRGRDMFGIWYFKAQPTEFVMKVAGGRVKKEGQVLSFYYLKRRTSIVVVPVSSADAAFVFNEQTGNYQAVTIQGQLTYRIVEPRRTIEMLNYVVDPKRRAHVSQDPERLEQRIVVAVQMETRRQVEGKSLEEVLGNAASISAEVQEEVTSRALLAPLGVELLSLNFTSVSPNPEVGKALEAEYRESLLRRADEAIYARRAAAVEEEGKIKSNELEGEISLARERERLIDLEAANDRKVSQAWGERRELEAGFTARASEMELAPYRDLDPRKVLALAMRDIGNNADKVGNLNITSEVLADLLQTGTNGAS